VGLAATVLTTLPASAATPHASSSGSGHAPARRVHQVGVRVTTLVDPTRPTPAVPALGIAAEGQRRIPLTVWYPARGPLTAAEPVADAPPARGRFPLIVWAHGNGARGANAPAVVRSWAALGYVVAAFDFPVSSRARANLDAVTDWAAQPEDVRFVLDRMLAGDAVPALARTVERAHVGIAGHSLGAMTVLAVGYGAHADPRVDAVATFAGIPLLDDTDVRTRTTPLLLVHGADDPTIPYRQSQRMFELASGPRYLVTVSSGGHSRFLQSPEPEIERLLATITTAFWDSTLRGDRRASARITVHDPSGQVTVQAAPQVTTGHTGCPNRGRPARDLVYRKVEDVDRNLVSLDVYPPRRGCPAPVVVWVHGGGFRVGDKRHQIASKVRLFTDLGYVLVSVNYRLTDVTDDEPVRYPTHADDVAAALAWIERRIARYGGDPDRVAVIGHSAGAQIVATLATNERILSGHGLALTDLACVAPLDTEGFDITRLAGAGVRMYLDAFGSDPAVWADASPITHVAPGKGIPPHLLVQRGTAARRAVLARYAEALQRVGVPVTTLDASGLSHNEINTRIGAPDDTVMTAPLSAFLEGCLSSRGEPVER